MRAAILFLASAFALPAQIESPRLGLLVDGTKIHTAWGVPGVAVTTPLREASAKFVVASPNQDFLLAVPSDAPGLLVLAPNGREDSDRILLPDFDGIDAIVFSARGTAAAIRRGARVDIITGLPARADIAQTFDLSFAGSESPRLSVSDDGSSVLAVFAADSYRMDASGMSRLPADGVLAAAFLPRSRDIALASQDKVTLLRDGQGPAEFAISGSAAKSLYATSRYVVAFDRDFFVVDLSIGQSVRLSADDEPGSLQPAGDVLFFLSGETWNTLDLSGPDPRLLRVPKRFVPEAETPAVEKEAVQ